MPRRLSCRTASLVLALAVCTGAPAAELGEPRVVSYIGQQLIADIELTALEDPAGAVQVRVASPDVYRGANVDMTPVLSSLRMNVMRRDGRQFLHITSLKPVEADHLHLYLELNDGGKRSVRLATLWFTPDPTPPAPPAPKVAPLPAVPAEPLPPPLPLKLAQPRPAPVRLARPAPAPAACKPQPASAPQPDPVCAGLDHKNADLRAQIVKLEEKVKTLQGEMKSRAVPAPVKAVPPMRKIEPVQPVIRPSPHPAPARVVAVQAAPPGLPWGWIAGTGAAVFVLIGAVRFWRSRRASAAVAKSRLKARAGRPNAQEPETAPVEPSLG